METLGTPATAQEKNQMDASELEAGPQAAQKPQQTGAGSESERADVLSVEKDRLQESERESNQRAKSETGTVGTTTAQKKNEMDASESEAGLKKVHGPRETGSESERADVPSVADRLQETERTSNQSTESKIKNANDFGNDKD